LSEIVNQLSDFGNTLQGKLTYNYQGKLCVITDWQIGFVAPMSQSTANSTECKSVIMKAKTEVGTNSRNCASIAGGDSVGVR